MLRIQFWAAIARSERQSDGRTPTHPRTRPVLSPRLTQPALTVTAAVMTVVAAGSVAKRTFMEPVLPAIPEEHRPRVVDDWTKYGPAVGTGPPVRIVVFLDYLCTHCEEAVEVLWSLAKRWQGGVTITHRHYPVRADLSYAAAVAAECAKTAGRFSEMSRLIFDVIDSSEQLSWTQMAREVGISDIAQYQRCLTDSVTVGRINRDLSDAEAIGVSGTPALLLDSLLFIGSPGEKYLEAYVRSALRKRTPATKK